MRVLLSLNVGDSRLELIANHDHTPARLLAARRARIVEDGRRRFARLDVPAERRRGGEEILDAQGRERQENSGVRVGHDRGLDAEVAKAFHCTHMSAVIIATTSTYQLTCGQCVWKVAVSHIGLEARQQGLGKAVTLLSEF